MKVVALAHLGNYNGCERFDHHFPSKQRFPSHIPRYRSSAIRIRSEIYFSAMRILNDRVRPQPAWIGDSIYNRIRPHTSLRLQYLLAYVEGRYNPTTTNSIFTALLDDQRRRGERKVTLTWLATYCPEGRTYTSDLLTSKKRRYYWRVLLARSQMFIEER